MDVIAWLLAGDPSIRWQTLRDLTGAKPAQVAGERARVAHEGWGARLLREQREDGHWDVRPPEFGQERAARWWEALKPEQKGTLMPEWTSTTWTLALLRTFGIDPGDEPTRRAVARVRDDCRWEHDAQPYFEGEVEPCINGRTVALGAYFGQEVGPIVERLLTEQMDDGGWNCEQENGSTRGSFHTTIEVLEGLLEFEQSGADPARIERVREARRRGEEYLLARSLMRRLSTGEKIEHDRTIDAPARWAQFAFPTYWHYDVLRALDYLRAARVRPDERVAEAITLVEFRRGPDGRWPADPAYPGRVHFALDDGEGAPSRWNTLRAMRVLRWNQGGGAPE